MADVVAHGAIREPGVRSIRKTDVGLPVAWVIGLIATILYASLIPFTVNWTVFDADTLFGLTRIAVRGTSALDIAVNLAVYVPLGAALVLCGSRGGGERLARIPLALTVGTAVSFVAEWGQTAIAERMASWTDVMLNAAGTLIGAAVATMLFGAVTCMITRLRRAFRDRPFSTLGLALTFGLFAYQLAPFDFVTDTAGLHRSLRYARWNVTHALYGGTDAPPFAMLVAQLSGAFWFGALGYLLALSGRERGRSAHTALGSAIRNGIIAALLIELLQLFTASHTFDMGSVVLRFFAVAWGAWSGAFLFDGSNSPPWNGRPQRAAPTTLLMVLILFQVAAMLLRAFDPDGLTASLFDVSSVHWLPLAALWRNLSPQAIAEMLGSLITYAMLATMMVIALRRTGTAGCGWIACALVPLVACAAEAMRSGCGVGVADLTEPALALLVAVGVTRVDAAIRRAPAYVPFITTGKGAQTVSA